MQIKTETDNLDVGVFRIFGQFQVSSAYSFDAKWCGHITRAGFCSIVSLSWSLPPPGGTQGSLAGFFAPRAFTSPFSHQQSTLVLSWPYSLKQQLTLVFHLDVMSGFILDLETWKPMKASVLQMTTDTQRKLSLTNCTKKTMPRKEYETMLTHLILLAPSSWIH